MFTVLFVYLFRSKERKEMLIVQPRKRCVLCVWMCRYVRDS